MDRSLVLDTIEKCKAHVAETVAIKRLEAFQRYRYEFTSPIKSFSAAVVESFSDHDLFALLVALSSFEEVPQSIIPDLTQLHCAEEQAYYYEEALGIQPILLNEYFSENFEEKSQMKDGINFLATHCQNLFQKAILDASEEELIKVLSWKDNYRSLRRVIYALNGYLKFCKAKGIQMPFGRKVTNLYQKVSLRDTVRNQIIRDPEHLYIRLKQCDGFGARHVIAKAVVAFLWEGYSIEEVLGVERSEVDFENETIRGRKISPWICKILQEYSDTLWVEAVNGNGQYKLFQDTSSPKFIRNFVAANSKKVSANIKHSSIRQCIEVLRNMAADNGWDKRVFTADSIERYASLYRMKLHEEKYGQLSDDDILTLAQMTMKNKSMRTQAIESWRRLYEDYCAILRAPI